MFYNLLHSINLVMNDEPSLEIKNSFNAIFFSNDIPLKVSILLTKNIYILYE